MTKIPIEQKTGGTPWWLWLVGALVLLGLLALLARGCDDNDATTADGVVEDSLAAGGETGIDPNLGTPFTSVDDVFADTTNLRGYTGREATFTNVTVTDVTGDSTFYVRAANGQRLFVVLEGLGESQTGGSADGRQRITDGETLSLTGRLEEAGDAGRYGITGADLDRVNRQGLILRARRVEEGGGAMGTGTTGGDTTRM